MDATITLTGSDVTSPSMAASALTLASAHLRGQITLAPGELESVLRDLANLRNKIVAARPVR